GAAERLEGPVMLAVAEFARACAGTACGSFGRGLVIATRAVDGLTGHLDAPGGMEMLGMLQLTGAYASRGLKRPDDSAVWAAQATEVAERTGETSTLGMY